MPTHRTAFALGLTAACVAGCSLLTPEADLAPPGPDGVEPSVSLTKAGERLVGSSGFVDGAPRYAVRADIVPSEGSVDGRLSASIPAGEADQLELRYLAALDAVDADARIGEVTVDGAAVEAALDGSVLTVPLSPDHGGRVQLEIPFSYTLRLSEPAGLLDALGGTSGIGEVGLLARYDDVVSLGHWFPLWIPEGNSTVPEPTGSGDIGNFPAATIQATLTVPKGWSVVDGGVHTSAERTRSRTTIRTEGYGIRDLVVSVLHGYVHRQTEVAGLPGVTVRAWAPASARAELAGALEEAALSLRVLSDRFVPYPWRELEVVSTPLGAGVAGMEWPGAVWVETSVLAGGVAGLDSLDGLQDLLGDDLGRMLATTRLWTLAHEIGHEWWHVLVGNDSLLDPAVDEPLAQHSACLVVRASSRTDPGSICEAHVTSSYATMRLMGTRDAPAAQRSDEFASALQYTGVIYGKAAAFYTALEERFGRPAVTTALQAVTQQHAFGMVTTEDLRATLDEELGGHGAFDRLWRRWMTSSHGDQDLGVG
jgi:hypothetical protein